MTATPDPAGKTARIFWSLASEMRRVLRANMSDEGKCLALETAITEAREELRHEILDLPPENSRG
jgi:hypothetical protein